MVFFFLFVCFCFVLFCFFPFQKCKVHLLGVGTRGQRPLLIVCQCMFVLLVEFSAKVVKSLLQYVMV